MWSREEVFSSPSFSHPLAEWRKFQPWVEDGGAKDVSSLGS